MTDQIAQEMLKLHNEMRSKHHVPILALKPELCKAAQEYADKLAKMDELKHNPDVKFGENLFMSPTKMSNEEVAKMVITSWYGEMKNFKFGEDPKDEACAHVTQMLWQESTELGVGHATNKDGKQIIVCYYNPPGNVAGKFKQNVLNV